MSIRNIFYKLRKKNISLSQIVSWGGRWLNASYLTSGYSLPPLRLFINVNGRCNARCKQCDVGVKNEDSMFYKTMIGSGEDELDPETLYGVFRELGKHRPLAAFNGVEPTLWKPLPEAIGVATSLGMKSQITTNGILLPKLAEELYSAGLGSVWLSLDGPEKLHDEIRGVPGAFAKGIEGLRKLQELREADTSGWPGPSLNVVATVFHMNQNSIYEFLKSLADTGLKLDEVMIHHLQFITPEQAKGHNEVYPDYPVTSISTDHSDPAKVDPSALEKEIEKIESASLPLNIRWKPYLKTEEEIKTWYRKPEEFLGNSVCRVFWSEIQILSNGELTGSQRCFPLKMGNINKTPFRELWNGREMKEWRRLLQKKRALPACSRCCSLV